MSLIRKKLADFAFYIQRAYGKMVTAKPSMLVITVVAVAFSIFLLGGGVYDILEKPLLAIPLSGRWIFYYPYTVHEQSVLDSLIAMLLYAIGATGFWLTYQSTKYAYKPRQAFIFLLIGATFIVIAYLYIEYVIWLKLSSPY